MPTNAHIREIGGAAPARAGAQQVLSSGPRNTPAQRQQPQHERRRWSDLFDWGHHNGTRISQAGDSHGS